MTDDDPAKIALEGALKPLEDSVRNDLRKWLATLPWLARVNVLIAIWIIFGIWHYHENLGKWIGLVRQLPVVSFSLLVPPLPTDEREAVDRAIANKSEQLYARLDQNRSFDTQAWTTAEIVLALPDKQIATANAILFFGRTMGPPAPEYGAEAAFAWRKWPKEQYPPSITVSSWVLLAMAQLKVSASENQVGFLLDNQLSNGAWPIFPILNSSDAINFSSTDATAVALWALAEQKKLPGMLALQNRIELAIRRGASWLFGQADTNTARWPDYPSGRKLISVSGFALHVLHEIKQYDLRDLDQKWLENLPSAVPRPDEFETSGRTIFRNLNEPIQTDDTRYYTLPWLVAATLDAYPSGNAAERAFALLRLEDIFSTRPLEKLRADDNDDWIVALSLIGMHGLASAGMAAPAQVALHIEEIPPAIFVAP